MELLTILALNQVYVPQWFQLMFCYCGMSLATICIIANTAQYQKASTESRSTEWLILALWPIFLGWWIIESCRGLVEIIINVWFIRDRGNRNGP